MASAPYLQDDITWCVSRAKPRSQWFNLFHMVKDIETYVIGSFLLVCTIFVSYLMLAFEENTHLQYDLFHLTVVILQTVCALTAAFKPRTTVIRIYYAIFLIVPFWLTQIYSAFLVNYMSHVIHVHQISTVHEIASKNFHLAGDHFCHAFLTDRKMVRFDIISKENIFAFFLK